MIGAADNKAAKLQSSGPGCLGCIPASQGGKGRKLEAAAHRLNRHLENLLRAPHAHAHAHAHAHGSYQQPHPPPGTPPHQAPSTPQRQRHSGTHSHSPLRRSDTREAARRQDGADSLTHSKTSSIFQRCCSCRCCVLSQCRMCSLTTECVLSCRCCVLSMHSSASPFSHLNFPSIIPPSS